MSDELIEIVDNIKQPSVWIRVLFMIVFAVSVLYYNSASSPGVEHRTGFVRP